MRLPQEKMVPVLNETVHKLVYTSAHSRTVKVYERERSLILLRASEGATNQEIAQELRRSHNTVGSWRSYLVKLVPLLNTVSIAAPKELKKLYFEALEDAYRSGAPCKYSEVVRNTVKLIACQNPKDYGFEISHWSLSFLQKAVIGKLESADDKKISIGAIYQILEKDNIRPWRVRYWLHSREKYEDYESYSAKVKAINAVYQLAADCRKHSDEADVCIYSFDEMTGTQALIHEYVRPVTSGHPEQVDPNYKRKGTTALIAFFDIMSGRVINGNLGPTRTEVDTAKALRLVVQQNKDKKHIFVCDNLNTHISESVVRTVAELISYKGDLGEKGKSGILKNKESRMEFLRIEEHQIQFLFTPIHCSWLNQVEIWFGIISRQLLRRGNFESVEELERAIRAFIDQWNDCYAHPFKWTYNSVPENPNKEEKGTTDLITA